MRTLKALVVASLAVGSSSTALFAGSFNDVSSHLDLDGTFLGYVDFDGDGQEIGEKLNVIYQQFAEANPQVPPIPLDFNLLFDTLGFGSIRSFGMSSTEVEDGLFRNKSVTLLEGDPAGLFAMYGLEPIPFRAARIAPADVTSAFSGRLNLNALEETVTALASQVMGPVGEGMVMQGLSQPLPGTDVTGADAIEALSGDIDFIMKQDFANPQMPQIDMWLSVSGAASLAGRLEPMLGQMGIQFVETEAGRVADLSMLLEDAPFGLFVEVPAGSERLLFYTNAEWVAGFGSGSERLVDSDAFKRVAGRLPQDAAFYAYSSGFDPDQLLAALEQNPEAAAFAPVINSAVDLLFGGFLAPSASATYRKGDVLISEGYAGFSYKGAMMALPAGIGAGVGAGVIAQKVSQANMQQSWDEESEEPSDFAPEADDYE